MSTSYTARMDSAGSTQSAGSADFPAAGSGHSDSERSLEVQPPEPDRPRVLAHRGASGLFPEHTRAAYMRALDEGADGLEIDVHLTRDGELVCFHDTTLERTTNGYGTVADTTLAALRTLDVASWKTPQLPSEYGAVDEQLMTLQDVLELLVSTGRDLELAIELKHPSPFGHRLEDRALSILLSYGWDPATSRIQAGSSSVEVSFMSFSSGSLLHLAEMVPTGNLCALVTGLTAEAVESRVGHRRFTRAVRPAVKAWMRQSMRDSESLVWKGQVGMAGPGVQYVHQNSASIRAWIARGSRLRVWTVDSVSDVDLLLSLGVQEITTNYPARVLDRISG